LYSFTRACAFLLTLFFYSKGKTAFKLANDNSKVDVFTYLRSIGAME
jgi:hypothetical protein